MKTAEEIIQEYLDRGYGLESLRILAESREEPLGGQMLEILDRLEAPAAREESGMAEVACDEAVFFVADDDGAADGESVDFDLMAETRTEPAEAGDTPAEDGESVADIVVGETAGADMVAYKTEAVDAIEPADEMENSAKPVISGERGYAALSFVSESAETGIWSRLWSKMAQTTPALAPSMAEEMEMAAALEVAPEPLPEEAAEEEAVPLFAEYAAEPVFEEEPAVAAEAEEPAVVMEEEPAVMEEPVAEVAVAEEHIEEHVEEAVAESVEEPGAVAASAEISADYIPGSVAEPIEPDAAVEEVAEEAVEKSMEEQPAAETAEEEPVAEEEARPEPVVEEPAAEAPEEPAVEEALPVGNGIGRREKRRRERLEKKKARRGRKNALAELPEPVSEHAEESGLPLPEAAELTETPEAVEPAEVAEIAEPEEEAAEEAAEPEMEPLAAETEVHAEAEEKFEPLVASGTLNALSAHSFAFAASLVALSQSELARAAEIIEQDRLAVLAVEQNNLEAALENEPEAALEDDVADNSGEDNVILFRDSFEEAAEEESGDNIDFEPCLRMLAAPECEDSGSAEEEPAAAADASVQESETESPMLLLLQSALERETALRHQLEEEYQTRLDTFATRLLEAQALAAANENRVAEKKAELDARCAVLDEMKKRLESEEEKQRELLRKVDEAAAAAQAKDGELARFTQTHEGLREEHGQLYREFEDLRKAYNEVVTDVMPALQNERDDLAMTVERQCAKEQTLRAGLKSSRKRLAAGYILGAAACLMLVTLPVANWLRSGEDNRQLAVDHQLFSELRETLDAQVRQNVDAQTRIVELERKITRARDEISKLDGRNKELAGLAAAQHSQGIAVFRPDEPSASGTPTRAMTMALQATVPPGGKLHVNEVMDPAGSIEQLAMENSARNRDMHGIPGRAGDAQMAQAAANAGAALPVSALARTDSGSTGSLRPQTQGRAARPAAVAASGLATVTAKVKKGEGVAQVVYRVLNTRDPDVIAWVISENKIRNDRRGNPLIQPNQELRLPKDGRIGQAADVGGVKRR